METLPEQKPPEPAKKPFRFWLLGSVIALLLLLLTAPFLVAHFISSPAVKQKIQQTVSEKTGMEFDWQEIGLSYLPYPAIALQQVTLTVPDRVQGKVAELRISPEILPLLIGNLRLSRLGLVRPEISLDLPESKTVEPPVPSGSVAELEERLVRVFEPLGQVAPNLDLVIRDGRLSVARGEQKLVEAENLDLTLAFSVEDPRSGGATLQGEVSELSLRRKGQLETIKDVKLDGNIELAGGEISVFLERLALAQPGLELSGNLALAPRAPGFTLNLSGKNIDVDATRRVALALAGDIPPTRDIFDYLRNGTVPQISFHSQGKTASELGDLKNIRIEGRLQQGSVSIPAIKLDLTEVIGDVVISEGVLQGTGMSTRLEGSRGHDGTLKVGLAKGNDLFQLELMLDADLAQVKQILNRIVENKTFNDEVDRITQLKGTGSGKLVLGDSLARISARVDVTDLNFTADYQRVPFPIKVTQGQVAFSENRISLKVLNGTLGQSNFSGLACQINLKDVLNLDISSGRFALSLDELYPWLATFDDVNKHLKELTQVTGLLDLSSLTFTGAVDKPEQWQFAAAGAIRNLRLATPRFPAEINLARGDFNLDTAQLTFKNLKMVSMDADLTLAGTLKGFPRSLGRIELSLDGRMGPDSVEWLRGTLEVPELYAIHTPLDISNSQVSWLPEATTSFKGVVSIEKGPAITADVDYHPEQLQIHRVTIKDQYSDASMVLDLKKEQRDFKFTGKLQHETLEALFVKPQFSTGQLEGDFTVIVPQTGQSKVAAEGQLTGENLSVLLPSGEKMAVDQVRLNADGPQVKVDITKITWKDRTWEPVIATVSFDHDRIDVRVAKAKLCGIDAPGVFSIGGKELSLDMTLDGKGLDVTTSYSCLTKGRVRMTGALDFSSRISAQGKSDELIRKMQGPLEMTFTNGVIKQEKMLARILEVLNVTEIVKGRLPDLGSTGFAYNSITVQGKFQNGKLLIEKLHMDGETLDILGRGEVDIEQETVNIELLAAPFKTVDTVVKNIPGVNYLLAGSLVAIPVSVKGTLGDPKVRVMSASSVGTSLLNLGERTIKAPLKLIESFIPRGQTRKK
jgi:AsmA-like C-terminal region/AsmA family